MVIKSAEFIGSFPNLKSCPEDRLAQFAFIGRSNVGKSSLINMLCERKALARVSNTPGKTQHLNFYKINENWYLVDLPGYGYAQTSKKNRSIFSKMIESYLRDGENVKCIFVLIDANIPPQAIDVEFINWLGEKAVPFVIVYTKTDRLSYEKLKANVEQIQLELLKYWNSLPEQFVSSARKSTGRDDIMNFIEDVIASK
ncbi:UNVERIFIED_CONTAM: hypothetical protein GTU68_054365 [Idotea baltica]|nr:hypothetical protein [Idotea baltica]